MTKKKQIICSSLLGVVLLAVIVIPKGRQAEPLDEIAVTDSIEVKEIVYKYGIPVDDYQVDFGVVQRNQNLSVLLGQHGFSAGEVRRLTEKSRGVFDIRKIKAGNTYAFFSTKDSIPETAFFVYEESPKAYVVFDVRGEYRVSVGQNPVEWKRKELKGKVESSLWMAIQKSGHNPLLASELANIFGWSVDFFGLQRNDTYRVVYEQEHIDGQSLNSFHVLGASMEHGDSTFYAIPFTQGGEILYYDRYGKSLVGAFLKAPLDFFRISSRFSNSRYHPVLKRYRAHHGVDYAAPTGTPVYAVGSGRVIAKGYQADGGGNYLKIRHNGVYTTSYMHLSRFEKGIKVGAMVRQKETIGYVGATGLATGPHLDFRVFENGRPIDPLKMKSQPACSVSDTLREQFDSVRDSVMRMLSCIPEMERVGK